MEQLEVRCYSGQTYAEEPREFILNGQRYVVERIVARWRTPTGPVFRVATPGAQYVLAYNESNDIWSIRSLSRPDVEVSE